MKVVGMDQLIAEVSRETESPSIFEEVSSKRPLSVQIMDNKGNPITKFGGDMTAPSIVGLKNSSSQQINPSTSEKQYAIISAIYELEISRPDGLAL